MPQQDLPLTLTIAPFPEGFSGNMDETFQQAYQNTTAVVSGNFLTGLILPPGSTLPTTDQGPVAMNETWYFWDSGSQTYVPQAGLVRPTKNFCKNSSYQIAQNGLTFLAVGSGRTPLYDMSQSRLVTAGVVNVTSVVGPNAGPANDLIPAALKYTVTSTTHPTLAATDLFVHEHLVEGADIQMIQGEVTSLSFSANFSVAGIYSVYLTNGARDASYVTNFTITSGQINTWVRINISGIPAFPTFGTWTGNFSEGLTGIYIGVVMATGSQWVTGTPNQWASGFFAGTASNNNFVAVTNNQMSVTGFKFEAATTPSYYQCPSFGEEYEGAIRYFFTTFNYQSTALGIPISATAYVANAAFFNYVFPRRMCQVPTVTPYSWLTQTASKVTNVSTGVDYTVASLGAYPKGVVSSPSGITAAKGDLMAAFIQADARLT